MRISRWLVTLAAASVGGGCDDTAPVAPDPGPEPTTHKILILYAKQHGASGPDLDRGVFEGQIFRQVCNFYEEVSSDRLRFEPEFFGWYEVPEHAGWCEPFRVWDEAVEAADRDVDYGRGYSHLLVITSGWGCTSSGMTIKPPEVRYATAEGEVALTTSGIDAGRATPMVLSHELGHQLHLGTEANFISCGLEPLRYPPSQCFLQRYGDFYTAMGGGAFNYLPPRHFSAPEKEALGFLAAAEVQELKASGCYTISPLERAGDVTKALKFPTANGAWIYVEYRQPIGFDAGMDSLALPGGVVATDVYEGALLHVKIDEVPYLFDASAAYGPGNWSNCTLHIGETFVEPSTGDSITVVARTPSALTLDAVIHDRVIIPP